MNQKGVAMVTAIVLALVVSVTAALVLNLTFRRFELSAFRTDRAVAGGTAEAGFQYTFARLDRDRTYTDPAFPGFTGFREVVQRKRDILGAGSIPAGNAPAEYVITCHDAAAADENQLVPAIHMGPAAAGKHLTIRIRFFHNEPAAGFTDTVPIANRPYRVRSFTNYGTGEQ